MGNYDDSIGNYKIICSYDYLDPKDAEKAAKEIEENEILPNDFTRVIREGRSK